MKIDFEPISSIADAEEVLAIVEIRTLFYPSTYVGDLEWDDDQLLASFLEQNDDPTLKQAYADEPTAGIQEAKGQLLSELYGLIEERHGTLRNNTPFEWNFADGLLLQRRDRDAVNVVSLGYLWLSLYWLILSDKNYIVIETTDRVEFNRKFASVFEQICCYAISGQSQSLIWYFGDSRSSSEFLRRLETVTAACGNGAVKRQDQLEAHQIGVNDAGVDVLAIETHSGEIRRNALAYLVGATIQQASRRTKVMGIDQHTRFTGYFERLPLLAYKGVLAVPFERSENDELTCRDTNCLYLAKEELIQNLGRVIVEDTAANLRRPGTKLLRATGALRAKIHLADNDTHRFITRV